MPTFLRRLFSVYPGEGRNAILFALLGYLWMLAASSGLKFADVLFLVNVGASELPTVYTLSACGMIAVASFLLYAYHHLDAYRVALTVILSQIVFYLVVLLTLISDVAGQSNWVWYALRVFGYLFFAVVNTCFWIFVDQYHHLRDAKRLYGLFGSAIFLGIASTGAIMRLGVLDLPHLIAVVVVLLVVVVYLIQKTSKQVTPVYEESDSGQPSADGSWSITTFSKAILASPYVLLLMVHCFLVELFTWTTEYSYLSHFQALFAPPGAPEPGEGTEGQLAQFLGQLLFFVSIGNLIFLLFFFSRLMRRFGIYSLLMVSSSILFFTFSNWLYNDWLLFPILGFVVVEGTIGVIDNNTFNLLLNAVPVSLKYRVRVVIEHFFEPIALLASGITLGWLQLDSKLLTLFLAACSIGVACLLRRQYLKALITNLSANAIRFERSAKEWIGTLKPKDRTAVEYRLLALLRQGDEESKLLAAEALLTFGDTAVLERFLRYVDQLTPAAKIRWLQLVAKSPFAQEGMVLDQLHRWMSEDEDADLSAAVAFSLAKMGLLHPEKALDALDHPNVTLRGAAIIALKKSWAHLSSQAAVRQQSLAAEQLQLMLGSQDEKELCMGLQVLASDATAHDAERLLPFTKHASPVVARMAMSLFADIADRRYRRHARTLISQLALAGDSEFRLHCLRALGKLQESTLLREFLLASIHFRPSERRYAEAVLCQMGLRVVPLLLALCQDQTLPDRCRLLAGRTLGRLAPAQLRANLPRIVRQEIVRAYFYFYYHHTLQERYPDLDLGPLQGALLTGYFSVLDFIIQLLGVAGSLEDCELLSRSLRSRSARVRSQVIETLEKSCDPKIFQLLQPLVDEVPLAERLKACSEALDSPLTLEDVLDTMERSPSLPDKIVAATVKYRLDMPGWRLGLRQQMTTQEEIFHHFAYELLES